MYVTEIEFLLYICIEKFVLHFELGIMYYDFTMSKKITYTNLFKTIFL